MKDKFSWMAGLIIIAGVFLVYVGLGSIEAETLTNLQGGLVGIFGLFMAFVGGILLKTNELEGRL